MTMSIGKKTIDWLVGRLDIDEAWSLQMANGVKWWPNQHAQTIELAEEYLVKDGSYRGMIVIRTELLRDFELNPESLLTLNELLMKSAAMAGPVYDGERKTLDLCSSVNIGERNAEWMRMVLLTAAATQVHEVEILAPMLQERLGVPLATSSHPRRGTRPETAEGVRRCIQSVLKSGQAECVVDFTEFTDFYKPMNLRPSALMMDETGFAVEFPFGADVSLCSISIDRPHPSLGNGIRYTHSFAAPSAAPETFVEVALGFNGEDLTQVPPKYGLGSFFVDDACGEICWGATAFIPRVLSGEGILLELFPFAFARAARMARLCLQDDWTDPNFGGSGGVYAEQRRAACRMMGLEPG